MTGPIRLKTTTGSEVEVPEYVQGHLLFEAMRDFRAAYEELTNLAHRLAQHGGGPSDKDYNASITPETAVARDETALTMYQFGWGAERVVQKMANALARVQVMAHGEVYDELIDPSLLGPQTDGNVRTVYTKNYVSETRSVTTHIHEMTTGMEIYAGLNSWEESPTERKRQPFVAISTHSLRKEFVVDETGEPIMNVAINDGDVYENMGDGDEIRGSRQKEIQRSVDHAVTMRRLRQVHDASKGKGDQGAFDVWNEVSRILGDDDCINDKKED